MMKHRTIKSVILFTLFILAISSSAANMNMKAELDSAYLLMGKQTTVHLVVAGEFSEAGKVSTVDSLWKEIELVSFGDPQIKNLGNNRRELLQDVIIQAFDSGLYVVPPFVFVDGENQVVSNSPALKVVPVAVDSLVTVHDYSDVLDPDTHFFDFVPDWMSDYGIWILLAIIVITLATIIYLKWLRHGRIPLMPARKVVPPFELAMSKLRELHDEHLCDRGEEKQYYTRLTEILRVYLDKRFGINAMEMTSQQIREAVNLNETTKNSREYVNMILEVADFVKFAKVRPLPDDNECAYQNAVKFVEETKPLEKEDDSNETGNSEQYKEINN